MSAEDALLSAIERLAESATAPELLTLAEVYEKVVPPEQTDSEPEPDKPTHSTESATMLDVSSVWAGGERRGFTPQLPKAKPLPKGWGRWL